MRVQKIKLNISDKQGFTLIVRDNNGIVTVKACGSETGTISASR